METNETTETPTVLDGEREVNVDNIKQLVTDIYTDPEMLKLLRSNLGLGESLGVLEPEYGGITSIYSATLDFSGVSYESGSILTSFILPKGNHLVVITLNSIVRTATQEETQIYNTNTPGPLFISSTNVQDQYIILGNSVINMGNNHNGWERMYSDFPSNSLSPYSSLYGYRTPYICVKHIVVAQESVEFNIISQGSAGTSITISGNIAIN